MASPLHVQLVQRAVAAFQRRAFAEAAGFAQQVLSQFGEDANALMILAGIRGEAGDTTGSIELYERARAVMPSHIHVLTNLAAAYRTMGRLHEARIVLEEALQIDRRFAIGHNNLGNVLLDIGDRDGAKRAYERAVVVQANYAEPVAGLARIAEEEHRLDDARRLAERALSLQASNTSAAMTRARAVYRLGDAARAAADLAALLRSPALSVTNRVVAEGYLGEALDKLGRYDEAFAAFTRANQQQYAQGAATWAQDQGPLSLHSVERLTAFVESVDLLTWQPAPPLQAGDPTPVFLVGFPRSGTTLLDQILASHPKITTLEERDTLVDSAMALVKPEGDFDSWATLSDADIEQWRTLYWQQVQTGLMGLRMRDVFVDKLPLNAVLLPLVYRLFPDAKIVLAVRDPRDTVLSCYQQRFGMNAAMFQLLRLDTATRYYDAVMKLVRASRAKLPLAVHEVRYEAVVSDFDATVGGLLEFLGVPWDDGVRNYAETAKTRAIGTPSASQVVQPLYATAQGKWRNYRSFLEPVLPALEPWVRTFGYEPS
ncbi:MAG: sulfotransferase [Alphaproteobacteria bacterium]|nr:sulfotransferase [Alphaproteobacteria bacterium]